MEANLEGVKCDGVLMQTNTLLTFLGWWFFGWYHLLALEVDFWNNAKVILWLFFIVSFDFIDWIYLAGGLLSGYTAAHTRSGPITSQSKLYDECIK